MVTAARQIQHVARPHPHLGEQGPARRVDLALHLFATVRRDERRVGAVLIDPPHLLALALHREHVVHVEMRGERLDALERAIDVRVGQRGELLAQHLRPVADFGRDAFDIVGDQAGAHAEEHVDSCRIDPPRLDRHGRIAVEIEIGDDRSAVEDQLEVRRGPVRADAEQFGKARPIEQSAPPARRRGNMHGLHAPIARLEDGAVERRDEICKGHARNLDVHPTPWQRRRTGG